MQLIETIIGKEKLEEYYNTDANNIANFINGELSEYLPEERLEQLENSISRIASIEYYKKNEDSYQISILDIELELCGNVYEKNKEKPLDIAKVLASYDVLSLDFFRNLYRI